jgi:hypothetical protein
LKVAIDLFNEKQLLKIFVNQPPSADAGPSEGATPAATSSAAGVKCGRGKCDGCPVKRTIKCHQRTAIN